VSRSSRQAPASVVNYTNKTTVTKLAGRRRVGGVPNAKTRAAMAEADSMLRGRRVVPARKFTRAEQRRIRAHILARGMTFKVFLPESLANWLRKKIRAGVFHDPAEAAFVAFQDLHELDRHPQARRKPLRAMLQAAIEDPRPGIPAEKVAAKLRSKTLRYARTKPPVPKPLPKPKRLPPWIDMAGGGSRRSPYPSAAR
jgi:antitoxin ParD1/3/4